MNWDTITQTVTAGWRIFSRDSPWRIIVTSFWVRSVAEAFLYTGIGWVGAGVPGAAYAFVGAVVLVVPFYALALVTDVPLSDRWNGTYSRLVVARQPLVVNFALRALPQVIHAAIASFVACVVVGFSLGLEREMLRLLPVLPLVLVAGVTCAFVGLFVIAPALGSRLDVLTYNVAITLILVSSGAVAPTADVPLLREIGSVLPLTHTIAAFRAYLDGSSPWPQIGLEGLVALGWGIVAGAFITAMSLRGRRSGRGNFAA